MLKIRETRVEDLQAIQRLWADGEVMKFVGFPNGLHYSDEEIQKWFQSLQTNRPVVNHYSLFEEEQYCGESFYAIDSVHQQAQVDIKLFEFARGRGLAMAGLSYAIEKAFQNGAKIVWVDPQPNNLKAIALYKRLGFQIKDFPKHLLPKDETIRSLYMELDKTRKYDL